LYNSSYSLLTLDARSTTGNLKLLCNFVEKYLGTVHFGNDQFAPILGYEDLVQGNIMINKVYYVEGLNHNLFSVGQFCDADLEVAFQKSTCFVRDLQGNDLLIASPTQAWLWHRRLSHLNFDYINLLSKRDVVIGLPKLKYVKDQLCSSCEVSKVKRSSFKSKAVPSLKGRLNLLHMDLCGPMRVASIKLEEIYFGYENSDPVLQLQNVSSLADVHVPSQQELDLLFGPLYDKFFTAGASSVNKSSSPTNNSNQQDTQPKTNIQPTSEPSTPTYVHAEDYNVNQAEEEHLQDDEFTNPFCTPIQEVAESFSHNIAMQEELHQFDRLQVWELVDKPFGKTVIRLKWLWKNKKDEDQTVIRNKARLVAKGGPYKPTTVLVQAVAATDDSPAIPEHTTVKTPLNISPENKAHFQAEKEAIHLILTGIGDEIYSTVDACQPTQKMWEAIERLQQGESLNIQDVKTNLFWEFGKFTSHDGETMESYYTRFYNLMNEMIRNNLTVSSTTSARMVK
nr:hypothetical protein [Tanacetum cinerariifolium]